MEQPSRGVPDGADLLDRIAAFITRFIVLPEGIAPLLAAWVVHTHAFAAAEYTPYVVVRSATKGCGKSRLLEVLELLVCRPLSSANVTPAALYHAIEVGNEPTLLLDEQDGIRDEDIRKVLNAGFRRGQMVLRTASFGKGVVELPAFCPKVIASIGTVASTVADRAIHVRMQRRLPGERVEPFRRNEVEPVAAPIRDDARAFAEQNARLLLDARPEFPMNLDDRGRDIYAPLFAIADLAGGDWPSVVRDAALVNRKRRYGTWDDPRAELLRDIRDKLEGQTGDFVFSKGLVYGLMQDGELRWSDWNRGRGLTQKALSMMLAEFDIHPYVRQIAGDQRRGYRISDFREAFVRYLGDSERLPTADDADAVPLQEERSVADLFMRRRDVEEEKRLTD